MVRPASTEGRLLAKISNQLDELIEITRQGSPSGDREAAPSPEEPAEKPAEKPAAKKAPAKKTTARRKIDGR
jgi:hypothetical protein